MSFDWLAIGPVLRFDAVRTARRGRFALFRALYAGLLLLVLFGVYTKWFGHDIATGLARITEDQQIAINDQARFAAAFFHTFLAVQLGVMLMLTPAFIGGAIAEEREKGTLNDLLLTDLSPAAIVVGKFVSRLAHLVLLVLAGVPILALLMLMGGVDPALLIGAFALTLLSMLSTAALTLCLTIKASHTSTAIRKAYWGLFVFQYVTVIPCFGCLEAITFAPNGFLNLFGSINAVRGHLDLVRLSQQGKLADDLPLLLLVGGLLHGLITYHCLRLAIRHLQADPIAKPGMPSDFVLPTPALGETSPLLWKDTQLKPTTREEEERRNFLQMGSIMGFTMLVSFFLAAILAYFLDDEKGHAEIVRLLQNVCLPLIVCLGMLRLTLRAAVTISTERQRQTLDSLLTTPLSNEEILRGKWLGCLAGQPGLNLVFALFLVCGLLIGTLPPLGLLLVALESAALSTLAIGLGMWVSVVSHSTIRATVTALVLLLAVTAGHWILYLKVSAGMLLLGRPDLIEPLNTFHAQGLTPPLNLTALATLGGTTERASEHLLAACMGMLLHAALALGLWFWLRRRFRALTGRIE